jgi:hypothetical protein
MYYLINQVEQRYFVAQILRRFHSIPQCAIPMFMERLIWNMLLVYEVSKNKILL